MKVLILHFRSGPGVRSHERIAVDSGESAGTDGVSLEMEKRARMLREMGHEALVSSAYDWSDIPIPELEFEREEVVALMHGLFDPKRRGTATAEELEQETERSARRLLAQLRRKMEEFGPELLFVHNIFSLPIHPAATKALGDYVRASGVPCAAIHHDVRSEGAYKFTPTCLYARRLLVDYFPPEMQNLRHWAINTLDRDYFRDRGIPAGVIHDTLDFDKRLDPAERRRLKRTLRQTWGIRDEDIVLLLSTRIVPNKQAELAGSICAELQKVKRNFVGRTLYDGRGVTADTRIVLVLAGRPERSFHAYRDAVFEHYRSLSVDWKYVGDSVMPRRDESSRQYALYPDTYAAADFALYPTRWEGFGNQFLEIVASELPAAVFEYPIYRRDLAPLGFDVVSLGRRAPRSPESLPLASLPRERLASAARKIWEILIDRDLYRAIATRNRLLGSQHFGLPVLRKHLTEVIDWARE